MRVIVEKNLSAHGSEQVFKNGGGDDDVDDDDDRLVAMLQHLTDFRRDSHAHPDEEELPALVSLKRESRRCKLRR